MATPKKRYRYTFLYTDQTYLTYELTREDFQRIEEGLTYQNANEDGRAWIKPEKKFVAVSIGIIGLENIRSIIEQKEEELTEEEETEKALTDLPVLDQESYNWLKQYVGEDK
jgi:hypothetical protein